MTKNQRIDAAINVAMAVDDQLRNVLIILNGASPLAADHIVEAQGQIMDAITHMQTRRLVSSRKNYEKSSGKPLTVSRSRGKLSA